MSGSPQTETLHLPRRRVLLVVTSDPRKSHRPGEAIRIAAGMAVWQRVQVALYLGGAAALCLAESPEGLEDEDSIRRGLELLQESGGRLCLDPEMHRSIGQGKLSGTVECVDRQALARMAAEAEVVCKF